MSGRRCSESIVCERIKGLFFLMMVEREAVAMEYEKNHHLQLTK